VVIQRRQLGKVSIGGDPSALAFISLHFKRVGKIRKKRFSFFVDKENGK